MLSIPTLISPRTYRDHRGGFTELFRAPASEKPFTQVNQSFSVKGVLRGLHVQPGQAKLVQCLRGIIIDVAVDVRSGSPTFGRWWSFTLTDDAPEQTVYIPDGFAHGFFVLSEDDTGVPAVVQYMTTAHYDPTTERVLAWNAVPAWPSDITPILSERDQKGLTLEQFR